jgi:RNA polymerase sigma factor (sigma-70 family)
LNFRPRKEHELDLLDDDALVAYIAAGRDAGHHDEARTGLGILAYRRLPDLIRRISMKAPAADVDDLASEVLASALKSAFAGEHMGEFVNWLHTITDRRVADAYRRNRPDEVPLPEEHEEAEEIWGEAAVTGDFTGGVDVRAVTEQLYAELGESHRAVVDHYVFAGFSAKETAEQVNMSFTDLDPPMTEDNVHQIAKRFRDELRRRLDDESG